MSQWIDRRRAGLLLHFTSLPGPFANGVIGEEAHRMVDRLTETGFSVWQFLPIGPTHSDGSPYGTLSTFAGNPALIDLRECAQHGWVEASLLEALVQGKTDPAHVRLEAAKGFWRQADADPALQEEVEHFCARHRHWLEDYARFMAIKRVRQGDPWWKWPKPLRERDPEAISRFEKEHTELIRLAVFEQFLFERQWTAFREHAHRRGLLLFGDLPIYVAHDSADVWANPQYFTLTEEGECAEVAGVPPDYFSASGQRWGNPLYRWDAMEADGFSWWIARVGRHASWMDLIRIDHFRGLEAYWAIPGTRKDGRVGEWRKAPGEALLSTLEKALGRLPLVAEDLGLITPEVEALRRRFSIPGMKVLQFAFGGDARNPYLPHNHTHDSVVYTGTHDNDTTLGWWQHADEHVKAHVRRYLGTSGVDMPTPLIRAGLASVSLLAVLPIQDILRLDSSARLNTPGTMEGNWRWRMEDAQMVDPAWQDIEAMIATYGR